MTGKKLSWPEVIRLPLEGGIFENIADTAHVCGRIKKFTLGEEGFIIFTRNEVLFNSQHKIWTPTNTGTIWVYTVTHSNNTLPFAEAPYLYPDRVITFYSKKAGIHTMYPRDTINNALEATLR